MAAEISDMSLPGRGGGMCNSPGCRCHYGHPDRPDPKDLEAVRAAQMAPSGIIGAEPVPPAAQAGLEAGS
jgi:hypothetical protein